MNDDIAIKVQDVYKNFKLPHERVNSIKSIFTNLHKKREKSFEIQHALKDISFEVKKGEFFGIVGRNGSGKSTLLKIIAEIYQPTSGKIQKSGNLVPFIELGVGFNPDLTGRENVYLNGALLGFTSKEIDGHYDSIVEFAELEKFMDQKLKNYSSGMQVRLAFAVAIRAEADILLVDEVLAVGDSDFQRKCFGYFRTLKRNKKTVVFVSHDMSSVQEYCDRAMLIDHSKIVLIDKPSLVASEYNKLFVDQSLNKVPKKKLISNERGPSGEDRWGDQQATLVDVEAYIRKDQTEIIITATALANQNIDTPIFGFSIKNQLLEQLIGTNTVRKGLKPEPMGAGEKRKITWVVPNIFNEGEYYVDCTIAHDDAISVADRWPDAVTLNIYRDEKNPYKMFSPNVQFKEEL